MEVGRGSTTQAALSATSFPIAYIFQAGQKTYSALSGI